MASEESGPGSDPGGASSDPSPSPGPTSGAPSASDPAPSSDPPSSAPSSRGTSLHRDAPETTVSQLDFAGWGEVQHIDDLGSKPVKVTHLDSGVVHKLGEFASTAICGNDITSSCLYVAALCAISAGPYAFLCLLAVAVMLYFFRSIYGEVGTALPLNGGAYNALLNTTSKFKASMAACLTILSYLATAVISAGEAMHYLHHLWHGLPVIPATVALLGFFALLSVWGMGESAMVAMGIFVIHLTTLTLLVATSLWKFGFDWTQFIDNWHMPAPGGLAKSLVFGFAAGLLGISGFESSANFIEEQKEGVFPKTLRNMWIAVFVFNPLISFLAMCVMPLSDSWKVDAAGEMQPRADFLAHMANISAGSWLASLVSVDAVLVLSGAVLTAYVGVTGLVRRMALDRCLPQILLRENKLRGTNHYIIIGFFLLCWSIVFITGGDITILAGVYTISFLSVMALFATGNMLLKAKRQRLPRAVKASWPGVIFALIMVLIGLVANALIDYPKLVRVRVFLSYFVVAVLVVALTLMRAQILKVLIAATRAVVDRTLEANRKASKWLLGSLTEINNQR
ncbi:MAG: APC family permease, partial [Planctomycetota bacterium]